MKSKILFIVAVFYIAGYLVYCFKPNNATANKSDIEIYVDRRRGVVCYYHYRGGVSCVTTGEK